jgi:hypothetical protein
VKLTCWHADPMGMGGRHASARSSALALAAPASDVIGTHRTHVVKNQFGRPLGLGGSTG